MKKQRRRLVHFLAVDTLDPLCGRDEAESTNDAVNGVALCPACARRMSEEVECVTRAMRETTDGAPRLGERDQDEP